MEILKTATEWAKAEVFSSAFFIAFGVIFVLASLGFWQLGKTDLARAYIIPTSVAGALLLIIGFGLVYANQTRMIEFETAYHTDAIAFIHSEMARTQSTLKEYKTIVFTAIPLIILACALGIVFTSTPMWRASLITSIAMLVVILLIDGTAQARILAYSEQLVLAERHEKLSNR